MFEYNDGGRSTSKRPRQDNDCTVRAIALTCGLPYDQIVMFFNGNGYFEGDTRENGELSYHTKVTNEDQEERYYWMMVNCMSNQKLDEPEYADGDEDDYPTQTLKYPTLIDMLSVKAWEECEDLQYLRKVITRDTTHSMLWRRALKAAGWVLNPTPDETEGGAVILQTGDVIVCPYMQHTYLYPILYKLGLASAPDWTEDRFTMHVSSGCVSGTAGYSLEHGDAKEGRYEPGASLAQIMALVKYKATFRNIYSCWDRLFESLRQYFNDVENYGGKYNNLIFLRTCYPHIKTPKFSKEPIPDVKNCLRTSPKYSLPGLLQSKFEITDSSIAEMEATFNKYKNVRENNEFHYFYQEFIPGINGVCHRSRNGFSYAIGDEQGDVVTGKTSGKLLDRKTENALRKIADEIHNDMDIDLQLEFVVTPDNDVYIVQLRKLDNGYERTVRGLAPTGVIVKGRTFSKGDVKGIHRDNILIVDEDAPSEALLGKQALIVKSNVEFSHILALSQALKIPSLYGTGDFKLPAGKVNMRAFNEDGYIYK